MDQRKRRKKRMKRSRKKRRGRGENEEQREEEEKAPFEQAECSAGVLLILQHLCRCVACTATLAKGSVQALSPFSWFTLS